MIDRLIEINGRQIAIAQDLTLSHAGTVWDGALTMVYYWNKNCQVANQFLQNKVVLELGSGTGITGICASAFKAKKVYLTDLPEYLKILQINKQKNSLFEGKEIPLEVKKLEWDNKQDLSSIPQVDTLIGSELAYDKQNVIRLMNTIKYYKDHNDKLKVVIAYQKYVQDWKNLKIKFEEYFPGEFKQVNWSDYDEDYRDSHIGILYIQ